MKTAPVSPWEGEESCRARLGRIILALHRRVQAEKEALSTALAKVRSLASSAGLSEKLTDLVLTEVRKREQNKTVLVNRISSLLEKGHRLPRLRQSHD